MFGCPVPDPVVDLAGRRIFNEMIEREHPLGARIQFGRQLRYLFGSARGWLGGSRFTSPALALTAAPAAWELRLALLGRNAKVCALGGNF